MSVGDFGALPPEINSARMYAGAGAEPMMAAASAWDSVAAELSSAAESYQATVNELTDGSWLGSSSQSMAAAAAPFVAWMNTTATKAEVTANQARSAAAAYEEAFAATVPPPVIEANRTLLAALIATNTLGQNATAIAATESQYAEMWAQDAEAMYGYAASSASASQVPMFTSAQQNTSDSGTTDQATATTAATSSSTGSTSASVANNILDDISNALTNFASGNGPVSGWLLNTLNGPLISGFNDLTTITSGDSYFLSGTTFLASGVGFILSPMINAAEGPFVAAASAAPAVEAPAAAAAGLASSTEPQVPGATASAGGAASATLGEAKSIGSLSTPPSWGGSSPAIRLASTAVPMATLDTLPAARLGGNGFFGGLPPVASVVNAPRGGGAQPGSERSRQRARAGASDHDEAPGMPGQPRHVSVAKTTEADANRDELNMLRKALADLTRERDILKRTASFMIQEARK